MSFRLQFQIGKVTTQQTLHMRPDRISTVHPVMRVMRVEAFKAAGRRGRRRRQWRPVFVVVIVATRGRARYLVAHPHAGLICDVLDTGNARLFEHEDDPSTGMI
jgi:hypothetical protein